MYRRDFESNKNVTHCRYFLTCFAWDCYLPEGQDEVESIKLCIVIRPTTGTVSRLHRSSRYCSFYNCTVCFLPTFSLYTGYFLFRQFSFIISVCVVQEVLFYPFVLSKMSNTTPVYLLSDCLVCDTYDFMLHEAALRIPVLAVSIDPSIMSLFPELRSI